jgi:hypothetical protein
LYIKIDFLFIKFCNLDLKTKAFAFYYSFFQKHKIKINIQIFLQPLIIECQENNTAVIFCDERHLPYSTILPISEGNNLHQKILKLSIFEVQITGV